MTRDLQALARAFLAAVSAPGLSQLDVERGLAAAFAEDARLRRVPATRNEIAKRRLLVAAKPVFAAFESEHGITVDEVLARSQGLRQGAPLLDELAWRLRHEAEWRKGAERTLMPFAKVDLLIARSVMSAFDACRRHELRIAAAKKVPAVGLRAVRRG